MRADLAALPEHRGNEQIAEPMLMLQRLDVLPRLPGDRRRQHGRQVYHLVDDGEPVGQPLVFVPVEVADQRPEAVEGSRLRRICPLPCRVDIWAACCARRQIFAGQQPAGAGQQRVDFGYFLRQRIRLSGLFGKPAVASGIPPLRGKLLPDDLCRAVIVLMVYCPTGLIGLIEKTMNAFKAKRIEIGRSDCRCHRALRRGIQSFSPPSFVRVP
jgi:hypothetical protein